MKKYSVIYADPPWRYKVYSKKGLGRSAESHYPTMSLEEIKALPIGELAAKDCALFMWITFPCMQEAFQVLEAWGFEYKTVAFVWDKMIHNPGRYTLSQTEFVLAFKKGKFPTPRGARNIRQLLAVPRGKHSEKPVEVIDGITRMFPSQDKIELFARKNYVGWDNWGLEIPGSKVEILTGNSADTENMTQSNLA